MSREMRLFISILLRPSNGGTCLRHASDCLLLLSPSPSSPRLSKPIRNFLPSYPSAYKVHKLIPSTINSASNSARYLNSRPLQQSAYPLYLDTTILHSYSCGHTELVGQGLGLVVDFGVYTVKPCGLSTKTVQERYCSNDLYVSLLGSSLMRNVRL